MPLMISSKQIPMLNSAPHNFPWSRSHPWDVDVLVVGGGPAGLSALTRLRWMKTFNPIPLSVVLVNSGPLGGLAKLGNSILTGPSLAFPAGELVTRLKKDLDRYPAPIIDQKVVSVSKKDNLFTTTLEDGRQITSLSVIMACGMLDLRNIHEFWQKGITATFGNRANILQILKRELGDSRKPVILGGPHLLQLQGTIHGLNPETILLINGDRQSQQENIIWGELQTIEKQEHGMKIHVRTKGHQSIEADCLIVEFNSLELQRTPLPAGLQGNKNGFMDQQEPGLFIAGDCGGPPFSAVVALGEGAKAGLEAYQYSHKLKYNKKAPLFAYYGDASVSDINTGQDDFILQDDFIPARLVKSCPANIDTEVWDRIDGHTSIAELQGSKDFIYEQITTLLQLRAITFCPQTGHTSPAIS